MSSILKVNTLKKESGDIITIGESGDVIKQVGLPITATQGTSSNPIVLKVTVAAKTSGNVYNGAGSSNAYYINGIEAPSFFSKVTNLQVMNTIIDLINQMPLMEMVVDTL